MTSKRILRLTSNRIHLRTPYRIQLQTSNRIHLLTSNRIHVLTCIAWTCLVQDIWHSRAAGQVTGARSWQTLWFSLQAWQLNSLFFIVDMVNIYKLLFVLLVFMVYETCSNKYPSLHHAIKKCVCPR